MVIITCGVRMISFMLLKLTVDKDDQNLYGELWKGIMVNASRLGRGRQTSCRPTEVAKSCFCLMFAPVYTRSIKKMKVLQYLLGVSGWVQVRVCELVTVCTVHVDFTSTQGVDVADQAIILTTIHCCHMFLFPGHTKSRWQ